MGKRIFVFSVFTFCMAFAIQAYAQTSDRHDVRRGNRDFRKGDYREAEIDYRKALVKDSTSVAAGYNLAGTLYRMEDYRQAAKCLESLKESAPAGQYAGDYFYNLGNVSAKTENWQAAVDAYRQALLRNPEDMDARENYIYARKKLEDQQNQQNQQNQDNKDKNGDGQNRDNNQGNNNDEKQNQDQDRNQDQNQDNNDGRNGQDRNQDGGNANGSQPKITPQAAQQMLQAIQAKEKETQEKVKKEKAQILKSRQKDKNW